MKSLPYRMADARAKMMSAVNIIMKDNDLPAYIMEGIIADVLGECRLMSKSELLRDIRSNDEKDGQEDTQKEGG